MSELLEQAFARVRTLPIEAQDDLARLLLRLAGDDRGPVYHLTFDETADLDAADLEIAQGRFATEEEVAAVFSNLRR